MSLSPKMARLLRLDLSRMPARESALPPEPVQFDLIISLALREIRYAFVHWLDWSVVLGCVALLEYCCKDRAWDLTTESSSWQGPARLQFFKATTFEQAIDICKDKGAVSAEAADRLHQIRSDFRNLVAHMNAVELGKDKIYPSMHMQTASGPLIPLENVVAPDNPIASKIAFWEQINHLSVTLVTEVHALVDTLYSEAMAKAKRGELGGAVFYS